MKTNKSIRSESKILRRKPQREKIEKKFRFQKGEFRKLLTW